jgi:diphthine-ammonia ligase
MKRFLTSWSGGKDSCYALMLAKAMGWQPVVLLNILNEEGEISRSHGIPKEILQRQAELLGLPIATPAASWKMYEDVFVASLNALKLRFDLDAAVFGDIDLQAHRDWEEKVCSQAGLDTMLPLWQRSRLALVKEMLSVGRIETFIVSCNSVMGPSFLGKRLDMDVVAALQKLGVDACGENGEYHTLVVNMPLFSCRMAVVFGDARQHGDYWFIEMKLTNAVL